ncbi:MAG: DUF1624 domain-containing protein [Methanomicrobium sp.]|nr:DUF1624 domain-containing protein [Methanomicrobium sp.]
MNAEELLNKRRFAPNGTPNCTAKTASRYLEIDLLRGIAIVMMVWFHLLFDLNYFAIAPVDTSAGFWRIFGYTTAVIFVAVAGISAYLSNERAKQRYSSENSNKCLIKSLKRGFFIFMIGVGISTVTFLVIGDGWIVFGILHLIGLSIMLSPLFMRFKCRNLVIGAAVIVAGFLIRDIQFNISQPLLTPLLIPLGITPNNFYSVDYEPLLPWFGVFLIGMSIAAYLYPQGMRRSGRFAEIAGKLTLTPSEKVSSDLPSGADTPVSASKPRLPRATAALLIRLGQNSLIIYLIHQPVLILLLSIVAGHLLL